MTIAYKVLGQSNPVANTSTTVYTVPASNTAVVSTVSICNMDSTAAAFSISVSPRGIAVAANSYINYNTPLPGNDTITLTIGITLGATDVVRANCSTSNVAVNVFGSEIY